MDVFGGLKDQAARKSINICLILLFAKFILVYYRFFPTDFIKHILIFSST